MIDQMKMLKALGNVRDVYGKDYDEFEVFRELSVILVTLSDTCTAKVDSRYSILTQTFDELDDAAARGATRSKLEKFAKDLRDSMRKDPDCDELLTEITNELELLLCRPDDYYYMQYHMYTNLFRVVKPGVLITRLLLIFRDILN